MLRATMTARRPALLEIRESCEGANSPIIGGVITVDCSPCKPYNGRLWRGLFSGGRAYLVTTNKKVPIGMKIEK